MKEKSIKQIIIHNFTAGVAYGLGLTVGIAAIAYLLSVLVRALGGLPLVGDFLAGIIKVTLEALSKK